MRCLEIVDRRWALSALALLVWTGCEVQPSVDREIAAIEYAGCAEVLAAGPCVLREDRTLRLWLPDTSWRVATDAPVGADGVPLVDRSREIDGGRLLWLTVPAGASRLEVRRDDPAGAPVWSLDLADASAAAAEGLTADSLSPVALAGYQAMARSQFDRAAESLSQARREHAAAGRRFSELSTATNVAYCHLRQRRLDQVRAVLDTFALDPLAPAETRFYDSYYRGMIAVFSGDARTALDALDAASSRARRLDLGRELGMSGEMQAVHLCQLGRIDESFALFETLRRDADYRLESDRARWLHNLGWSLLLAHEAGEMPDVEPVDLPALLAEVREIFRGKKFRTDQHLNVRLNLALADLQDGRPTRARGHLDEAAEWLDESPIEFRPWWLDIRGRIALDEGHADEALAHYDRMERLAESVFDTASHRRALVGRARALVAAGRGDAARAALVEAERLLDEQSQWIPLDQGRESFVAGAVADTGLLLDLLLREGRETEAFAAARRSRSRVLRGLQFRDRLADLDPIRRRAWERAVSDYHRLRAELDTLMADDWRSSADQLDDARRERVALDGEIRRTLDRAFAVLDAAQRPMMRDRRVRDDRPGELTLAYHPLPTGWVGFAALDGEIVSRRFELPVLVDRASVDDTFADDALLAGVLLDPFEPLIAAAARVRVLPFGVLRRVDFHALPFAGEALVAGRPVVYGLDVARPPTEPTDASGRRALIVADPLGDLPAAALEAERVRRALRRARRSFVVETLRGGDARAGAVVQRLSAVDWLHVAGHGVFSGRAGWRSALPLADGSRLTLGDLLALERAPTRVVLSACDAARVPSSIGVEGLGLAHGFLLAGARQVVAADRPVDDAAAADLVEALYREQHRVDDLAEALRWAQLERRDAGDASWAAFRVLEP